MNRTKKEGVSTHLHLEAPIHVGQYSVLELTLKLWALQSAEQQLLQNQHDRKHKMLLQE